MLVFKKNCLNKNYIQFRILIKKNNFMKHKTKKNYNKILKLILNIIINFKKTIFFYRKIIKL